MGASFSDLHDSKFDSTVRKYTNKELFKLLDNSLGRDADDVDIMDGNISYLLTSTLLHEWLETRGAWLDTRNGLKWISSKYAHRWFDTRGGHRWLNGTRGQIWLESRNCINWLNTIYTDTTSWLYTDAGYNWITPLITDNDDNKCTTHNISWSREWVIERVNRQGDGYRWLNSACGKKWLSTESSYKWLCSRSASLWLDCANSGYLWLNTPDFTRWASQRNHPYGIHNSFWLQFTTSCHQWIDTCGLQSILTHNKQWLTTLSGKKWLVTSSGCEWLNNNREFMIEHRYIDMFIYILTRWFNTYGKHDNWFRKNIGKLLPHAVYENSGSMIRDGGLNTLAISLFGQHGFAQPTRNAICIHTLIDTSNSYYWLNTPDGKTWLVTDCGKNWLESNDNNSYSYARNDHSVHYIAWATQNNYLHIVSIADMNVWLDTDDGILWLDTDNGMTWLATKKRGSYRCNSSDNCGQSWLESPRSDKWLSSTRCYRWIYTVNMDADNWFSTTAKGKVWVASDNMFKWLVTYGKWLETKCGCVWLGTDRGMAWLKTNDGIMWLSTDRARLWLTSANVNTWLATDSCHAWLATVGADAWLATTDAWYWLASDKGWKWLTTLGKSWFYTDVGQAFFNSDICDSYVRKGLYKPLLIGFFAPYYKTVFGIRFLTESGSGKLFAQWLCFWVESLAPDFTAWLASDDGKVFFNENIGEHIKKLVRGCDNRIIIPTTDNAHRTPKHTVNIKVYDRAHTYYDNHIYAHGNGDRTYNIDINVGANGNSDHCGDNRHSVSQPAILPHNYNHDHNHNHNDNDTHIIPVLYADTCRTVIGDVIPGIVIR